METPQLKVYRLFSIDGMNADQRKKFATDQEAIDYAQTQPGIYKIIDAATANTPNPKVVWHHPECSHFIAGICTAMSNRCDYDTPAGSHVFSPATAWSFAQYLEAEILRIIKETQKGPIPLHQPV